MAKLINTAVAELNIAKVGTIESVDCEFERNKLTLNIFADNANITIEEIIDTTTEEFNTLSSEITYSATEEDELMTFSDTAEQLIDKAIEWQEANSISYEQIIVDGLIEQDKERMMEM